MQQTLPSRNPILQSINAYWQQRPLASILLMAALARLVAVLFSKGYGMHDDHFLIIERAQMLTEGNMDWYNRSEPFLHSLIYPGLHYYFFVFLETLGITDPQNKMYLVRLIHGAYSLLFVYYGYRIALKLSGERHARWVGLALALFWCLPFLSVRNLREIVCIPPVMAGFYYLLQAEEKQTVRNMLLCGFLFSLAFILRFQAVLFAVGIGLYLLFRFRIKDGILFSIGFLLGSTIEGIVEWKVWGTPFITLYHYIAYNKAHAGDFPNGPWYQYFLTVLGMLLPPAGLALFFGFFVNWKRYAPIFWAVAVFFAFHSYEPNKQERFIFTIIPLILLLGVPGWIDFTERSAYWQRHRKFLRIIWVYMLVLNTLALLVFMVNYTKKSRVEAMYYLHQKADFQNVIVESYNEGVPFMPRFYLDHWNPVIELSSVSTPEEIQLSVVKNHWTPPNYIIFFGDKNLEQRLARVQKVYPVMQYQTQVQPSFVDNIAFLLNPKHNVNETAYIYKIGQ